MADKLTWTQFHLLMGAAVALALLALAVVLPDGSPVAVGLALAASILGIAGWILLGLRKRRRLAAPSAS